MSEKLEIAKIIYESAELTPKQKLNLIRTIREQGDLTPIRKTVHSVAGLAAGGVAGYALYRIIRAAFDKCTQKCGTLNLNTPSRQKCMQKCNEIRQSKIKAARKQ